LLICWCILSIKAPFLLSHLGTSDSFQLLSFQGVVENYLVYGVIYSSLDGYLRASSSSTVSFKLPIASVTASVHLYQDPIFFTVQNVGTFL
jgi:hypothetical protein